MYYFIWITENRSETVMVKPEQEQNIKRVRWDREHIYARNCNFRKNMCDSHHIEYVNII